MPKLPSGLQSQVLSVLWSRGPSTAREVLEALPDEKQRAYTTVLSTMQVMEKKGLIRREKSAGDHPAPIVYAAAVSQHQTLGPMLKQLLRNAFNGRPSAVLQHLLAEGEIDDAELAEIRRILDQHDRENPIPEEVQ